MRATTSRDLEWWQCATGYQIYPKSFLDSDGDGIGDIPGIVSKLDYLAELGIGFIWLSPVYRSPMADNGYDISDYEDIAPEFGTLADLDTLIAEARRRDIGIVMDLVVNHTSDEHLWFRDARASRESPLRDFYIWRDPAPGGGPPDATESFFGGSAWTLDEETEQYYLHLFDPKQPDLNWDEPAMRERIWAMMRRWLDRGIAGFRMDVIDLIGKDIDAGILADGPTLHEHLSEMHRETLAGRDVVAVGETWSATPETALLYSGRERGELSMVFQFEHVTVGWDGTHGKWRPKPFDLVALKRVWNRWQAALADDGWNALFWSNHDLPRAVSTWGDEGEHRVASAKMLATVLHLMKGTPYVFQGEELGMTNARFTDIARYRDVETLNRHAAELRSGGDVDAFMLRGRCERSRQRAHADAVVGRAARRLHDGHAVDRAQPELPRDQRRLGARRSGVGVRALPDADRAPQAPPDHRGGRLRAVRRGGRRRRRLRAPSRRGAPERGGELHGRGADVRRARGDARRRRLPDREPRTAHRARRSAGARPVRGVRGTVCRARLKRRRARLAPGARPVFGSRRPEVPQHVPPPHEHRPFAPRSGEGAYRVSAVSRSRIALVGAGYIGRAHLEALRASRRCEPCAIVDPSPAAAALAAEVGVPHLRSLEELLGHDRSERARGATGSGEGAGNARTSDVELPDGVILATPNHLHVEQTLRCVERGLPVLLEKPLAPSVTAGETIVRRVREIGARVLVGHHRTHGTIMQRAREVIASGALGRLVTVSGSATFVKPDSYFDAGPWRREPGGGPILINLIHEVHGLRLLCGEIVAVQAFASNAVRGHAVEDTVTINLRFANGVLGNFLLSDTAASPRSWEQTSGENPLYDHHDDEDCYVVAGTRGSLSVPTMRLRRYARAEGRSWWQPLESRTLAVDDTDPVARQLEHFGAVVRGEAEPLVSVDDALANLRVTEAVARAALSGETVPVGGDG